MVRLVESSTNSFSKIYSVRRQNVTGQSVTDPEIIKKNLVAQLTSPVCWTQTMLNMIASGVSSVVEVGPGTVLQGLFKKVDRNLEMTSASIEKPAE